MTLTHGDYQCLMGFLASSDNAKEAEAWLNMWFDEKIAGAYKEGWVDACEYNGCEYDGCLNDDHCGGMDYWEES